MTAQQHERKIYGSHVTFWCRGGNVGIGRRRYVNYLFSFRCQTFCKPILKTTEKVDLLNETTLCFSDGFKRLPENKTRQAENYVEQLR